MIKEFRKLQSEIDESIRQINSNRALLSSVGNEEEKASLARKSERTR
jgi:predicted  nucleic acid-binding Zn-ribbon protein